MEPQQSKFSKFMMEKYWEWERRSGSRKTLTEFARYLGVSQPVVSQWLNGRRKPNLQSLEILASVFGDEVYDAAGVPRPDPDLQALKRMWADLSPGARRALREQAERYRVNPPEEETPTAASQRSETLSRE